MKHKIFWPVAGALGLGLFIGACARNSATTAVNPIEPPANAQTTRTLGDLQGLSATYADIAKRVTPAVVNIQARKVIPGRIVRDPFFDFFGGDGGPLLREPDRQAQSVGSGVIVNANGLIVTNNHVVQGANTIQVTLNDKRRFPAKLLGVDPPTDVAVLKIEGRNLPFAPWADSDKLEVGEIVLAVGSPFGLASTVTQGIISAKGRRDLGISAYEDFLQTDAAINPGNSGGALVDLDGDLIGINTAILTSNGTQGGNQGIGLAIPAKLARRISEQLASTGRVTRGWVGLAKVDPLTEDIAAQIGLRDTTGVLVSNVYVRGPAGNIAWVEGGANVVLKANGTPIESPGQLRNLVADLAPGSKLTLSIWQQGKINDYSITVAPRPARVQGV
jgi:Do/DeqQ family serine protease